MKPNRRRWDYAAIGRLARDAKQYETAFGRTLQQWLPASEGFLVQPHESEFDRHDVRISRVAGGDAEVLVELECGMQQPWWRASVTDNRTKWPLGLNVLARKIAEGKHYDLFIKHNMEGNSFFACTFEFAKERGRPQQLKRHKLGFQTDRGVYSIPWDCVDDHSLVEFCCDDPEKLRNLVGRLLDGKAEAHASEGGEAIE